MFRATSVDGHLSGWRLLRRIPERCGGGLQLLCIQAYGRHHVMQATRGVD